jgi:hypothetical protein
LRRTRPIFISPEKFKEFVHRIRKFLAKFKEFALVATNNNEVQKPVDILDRMHGSREKQIEFNKMRSTV